MGRPPISASGCCPAFLQEGCVTSPWANPKRQPLYHKSAVAECVEFHKWEAEGSKSKLGEKVV